MARKPKSARKRETIYLTTRALKEGRIGIISPSGRLAQRCGLRLIERDWVPCAVMIARDSHAPIDPVHIQARTLVQFYLLDLIYPTLRDITLFHENLNKYRQPYRVRFGTPTSPVKLPAQSSQAIDVLRLMTLTLGGADAPAISLVRNSRPLRGFARLRAT